MTDIHIFHCWRRGALAVLAACLMAAPARAEAPFSFKATPGKLPKDVVPVQYAVHLTPNLKNDTFLGAETVAIDVLAVTSVIVLNAVNLDIDSATLAGKQLGELKLQPLLDAQQQTLRFQLDAPLAPGRYALTLKFRGRINREARGMFHMSYKVGTRDKKMLATTMAPSDARRLLPSWDEPAFRATFKLIVDVPAHFKAYSNTPIDKQERLESGLQRTWFGVTPNMPSYLLVLVAGELERLAGKRDGVEIGIVTTEGKLGAAAYPLAVTADVLHYYNDYFGVPYPLAKLDQIAIPGGLNGAMENWGAIVYNESALLVDPATSPDAVRQRTFSVNAHEVAHQWFGNLVTMAWWDNLWLNEGFASWMAAKASAHFHPEWRPELDAQLARESVLNLDAQKTTHPIQTAVATEAQAANAFDAITYGKGQALLRMLEAYLGEQPFRKGMRAYMARHKYSSTTSADLWAALEAASGKPVEALASDWTTQAGFPVIGVSQRCKDGKREVTLTQELFRLDEPAAVPTLWRVPLQIGKVDGPASTTLLTGPRATVVQSCDGVLVVDPNSMGFFRVEYDQASFDALASQVTRLPDATRLKFQADAWGMVMAGRMPLAAYFKLIRHYAKEPRGAVLGAILVNLSTLDALAAGTPEQAQIRRFTIDLARPKFDSLGWEERSGEPLDERQLRAQLAAMLARAGDPAATAEAKARFARYLKAPASVSPSMIDFILSEAGRNADAATLDLLTARLHASSSIEESQRLVRALVRVADPVQAARVLQLALSPQLPPHTTTRIVSALAGHEHVGQAWEFAVAHRDALLQNEDAIGRERAFAAIVANSADSADAERMEDYVRQNFGDDALVEAQRVGNGVRLRAALKARLLPQVRAALQ